MAPPAGRLTVFYDDHCPVCTGALRFAGRRDGANRLRPRGMSAGDAPFCEADLIRELHVVDGTGRVYRGYDAVVAIASTWAGVRRIAPLLAAPWARLIGRPLYGFVARRRRRRRKA